MEAALAQTGFGFHLNAQLKQPQQFKQHVHQHVQDILFGPALIHALLVGLLHQQEIVTVPPTASAVAPIQQPQPVRAVPI